MTTFISLDLETTGLDPQEDTIIEIAAIRFEIEQRDSIFHLKNISERSMLINPKIPLAKEVILITQITDDMLRDKPEWGEVQKKVQDFIGEDSVIIGHNVLFDIAMLKSHGINISDHVTIDTFELAEIFSQKAESLNLGFLGDFYNIEKRGVEHRALTDTWMTTDLFIIYLNHILTLSRTEKTLLFLGKHKDSNGFLACLEQLTESSSEISEGLPEEFLEKLAIQSYKTPRAIAGSRDEREECEIVNLNATADEEITLIHETLNSHGSIEIFVTGTNTAHFLREKCNAQGIENIIKRDAGDFLAAGSILRELKSEKKTERKYLIFLIKMIFWTYTTQDGTLRELKYYGQEYALLETFRLTERETTFFREQYLQQEKSCPTLITPLSHHFARSGRFGLFKDIISLEEPIRRSFAHAFNISKMRGNISHFKNSWTEALMAQVSLIEALYLSVPERPTGENVSPPGRFGETYFFPQKDLWQRHAKWLVLATNHLRYLTDEWIGEIRRTGLTREENIILDTLHESLDILQDFHTKKYPNKGVVLHIMEEKTTITLINREIPHKKRIFQHAIGYGYGIANTTITRFLQQEFGTKDFSVILANEQPREEMGTKNLQQITHFSREPSLNVKKKVLVLTTNTKDIRHYGERFSHDGTVFMQGINGGKSKIIHYFEKNQDEHTFLIGLIESWKDAFSLFGIIDQVIITKIPFDPPTDPFFLAKTEHLSNSFESHTKPLVLAKLNTLIGNIHENFPQVEILSIDPRIDLSVWGQFLKKNLL